jgi:dihydrofolate reductase
MSQFKLNITMSLDGFVAGPNQSVDNPLGLGGKRLHEWAFALEAWRKAHGLSGGEINASAKVVEESLANVGAVVMGRNMFGGHPGPWHDDPERRWNGWWGEDPPFHTPVFVVTHHRRAPLTMQGGTTFHFVSEGIVPALAQAKQAAHGKDVALSGGASVVQQYLAAKLVDELNISVAPVLLGAGERLFANLDPSLQLEQIRSVDAPGVTHLRYKLVK